MAISFCNISEMVPKPGLYNMGFSGKAPQYFQKLKHYLRLEEGEIHEAASASHGASTRKKKAMLSSNYSLMPRSPLLTSANSIRDFKIVRDQIRKIWRERSWIHLLNRFA